MWSIVVALALAEPGLPPGLTRVYTARDAAAAAMLDGIALPRHEQIVAWYVYNNAADKDLDKSAAALSFTVNAVMSQSPRIVLPAKVDGGRVLRWNLEELCPRHADFKRLWNELQKLAEFEPYFSQPASIAQTKTVRRSVPRYRATDGQWYDYVVETVTEYRKTEPGVHAGGAGPLLLLRELCGGNLLPICRGDWLVATAWSAADIDGIEGRYYELAGIERNPRGKTAFEAFLQQFGGDEKAVEKLASDQRTVMVSGVTKRPRRIDMFPALAVRPEFGPALITVTHDLNNQSVKADRDPLLNLLDFKDQAREIIAPGRNGLHRFLLTDGQGAIQDLAPDNVAVWRESPHPGSTQLINGISCLGCHGGNRGYNPTRNYVRELMADGFVPTGDISAGLSYKEVYERLRGLYDGEFDLPLRQAANGYAMAVDRATWGVFGAKSVEGVSAEVVRMWGEYFAHLTPDMVLREIGYEYAGKLPIKQVYRLVIPKVADEHGWIAAPASNLPLVRQQVHAVYYEMSLRDVLRPKEQPPAQAPGNRPKPGAMINKNPGRGQFSVKPDAPPAHRKPEWRNDRSNDVRGERPIRGPDAQRPSLAVPADRRLQGPPRVFASLERSASLPPRGTRDSAKGPSDAARANQAPERATDTRNQPFTVEWVDGESPGFEWHAPPGSQLWYFNTYGGKLDHTCRKFCGLKTMKENDVWVGYELTLRKPTGEVLRGHVDLFGNRRIIVRWK